jgi:hypothetical protein
MDSYSWCLGYASSPRDHLYIGVVEQLRRLGDFTPELLSDGIKAVRFAKVRVIRSQSVLLTYLFEFPIASETLGLLHMACQHASGEHRYPRDRFADFQAGAQNSPSFIPRRTFVHEMKVITDTQTHKYCMMFDLELPLSCVDHLDVKKFPQEYWAKVDVFRRRFGLPKGTQFPNMCDCPVCRPEQWGDNLTV